MKYRQKPSDFIVEEIANHNILNIDNPDANYKLYLLTKENIETFSLIEKLSSENNIPKIEIGFAGLKDTHAITKQYISIPKKYDLKSSNVKFLGYISEKIKLGNLQGNRFILTINELTKSEIDEMYEYSKYINDGIINYFDSQRFGSVIKNKFIGKYLIQKKYEEAVKIYLTNYVESENRNIIFDKEKILSSWNIFNIKINNNNLRKIVFEYKKTKNWLKAYKLIPSSLKELYISSYQSYIWNECIKKIIYLNSKKQNLFVVPYYIDELYFSKEKLNLPKTFQTISHKIVLKDYEKNIVEEILKKEEITISQLNIRQTGNFFKTNERDIIVYPKDFKIFSPIKIKNLYSVKISFELPKGSYATIVLKYLFGK